MAAQVEVKWKSGPFETSGPKVEKWDSGLKQVGIVTEPAKVVKSNKEGEATDIPVEITINV